MCQQRLPCMNFTYCSGVGAPRSPSNGFQASRWPAAFTQKSRYKACWKQWLVRRLGSVKGTLQRLSGRMVNTIHPRGKEQDELQLRLTDCVLSAQSRGTPKLSGSYTSSLFFKAPEWHTETKTKIYIAAYESNKKINTVISERTMQMLPVQVSS